MPPRMLKKQELLDRHREIVVKMIEILGPEIEIPA
jgi:hypothetical protein